MNNNILPREQTMYEALLKKDGEFEGIFFAGIKTTGIFCRPSCTARKPKKENVEYFSSAKSALHSGYRPCKVCHPMKLNGEFPGWIKNILNDIDQNQNIKLRDSDLRTRGIDPARIRRWFKKESWNDFSILLTIVKN